jgi:nicotinamide-nucleotide amidase
MKKTYSAEIISIGTELLMGEIVDTNSSYLSAELVNLGYSVFRKSTVGDNLDRISHSIKEAIKRSDLVILGGGLGPTDDDLTREAICQFIGEKPEVSPELLEELQNMFKSRNRKMAEKNIKQAWIAKDIKALKNPIGTACGWLWQKNKKIIVAMPGPPEEMKRMWTEQVKPLLPASSQVIYHKTIHTAGIGESDLAELIPELTLNVNPSAGTYARESGVDVRIAASAETLSIAQQIAAPAIKKVESTLADYIYGYDDDTLSTAIMQRLNAYKQTLSCMESVTGGSLASELTDCPGISSCFVGGIVTYNNEMKILAGVPQKTIETFGAVSEEVATAMAQAARNKFSTDWAMATTGVAGPEAHAGIKPGFAWVAVAGPDRVITSKSINWPGNRSSVKRRTRKAALVLLLNALKGNKIASR